MTTSPTSAGVLELGKLHQGDAVTGSRVPRSAATRIARRVLPTPPGPIRLTRRAA